MEKVNLFNMDLDQMQDCFQQMGEKPFRAKQVFRWIHHMGISDFGQMSDLAKSLRVKLESDFELLLPDVVLDHISLDGTRKILIDVGQGNAIETVYIPEQNRGTLCVSSQAGCAVNCRFCSTGHQGFNRNLTTGEIISQLWMANHLLGSTPKNDRLISNVVMMGMGEPLLNYDAVVLAMKMMLDDHGYGLSRRRLTMSTSGVVPMMDRLKNDCPVALAVSLHAPNDELRNELVPLNKKYPLKELMAACLRYLPHAPRDFITFEYVMLQGVNDSIDHAKQLVRLVKDVPCKFNLIPFNPFEKSGLVSSKMPQIKAFSQVLLDNQIVTTIRKTRGEDINAACGQLAGQVQDRTKRDNRMEGVELKFTPYTQRSNSNDAPKNDQPTEDKHRVISFQQMQEQIEALGQGQHERKS